MSRVRRVRGIVAVLATLVAATLATTAQGDAHAATGGSGGSGAAKPAKTTLHLHITGCDSCSVQLQRALNNPTRVWTSSEQKIGSDHSAVFHLRTSRTHGLSFVLRAPWEGGTGAVPNIVTRYAGHRVDTKIGRSAARHGKRAQGCWAGTTVDDVRLDFHVARVSGKTLDGQPTQMPLAYATHTMSSWKPTVKTYRGTIGNQDAFYCTKPPTTKLTLRAANCTGCQIGVMNGAGRVENTWDAGTKTMKNGQVTFRVPRNLTRGITTTVYGPWEGNTGYTALVAWRYAGQKVGDAVSLKTARAATHGSACWGGTSSASLTIPLTIRKVRTGGNTGPTNGTLAYAKVTQAWLKPRMQADRGILGSQEVITCQK
jgi:hypothetical protein